MKRRSSCLGVVDHDGDIAAFFVVVAFFFSFSSLFQILTIGPCCSY